MKKLLIISVLLVSCLNGFGQLDILCVPTIDTLDGQKVYSTAEKPTEFNGGQAELFKYIQQNLRYPTEYKEWQGSIYLTFIVDTLGNIRNECISKRHSKTEITPIEKEALRIITEMPKWIPAEQSGRKVYMRFMLPIKF